MGMKAYRIYLITTLVVLAIAVIGAYFYYTQRLAAPEGSPSAYENITVTDFLNRTVTIPRNIKRVVAIGPGALRLIAYLNATDLLVGVEQSEFQWSPTGRDYAMVYLERLKILPVVGPGGPNNPPDPEKLRMANPQLIVMSRLYNDLYPADRLSGEVGAPVLVIDYGVPGYLDVASFKNALSVLGKALGREQRAQELASYIDSLVADLNRRTAGLTSRPNVYVGAISYKGAQPFTSTQIRFPPLRLLNTPSIADSIQGKSGYFTVDFEYILQEQPDYIFIDEGNIKTVLDDFAKDPAKYCQLKAFREGRVFGILPFNFYHTNVATALADAYYMGKVLYPDRFQDVDPVAKADEIYKAFLGKPLYNSFITGGYMGFASLSYNFKCRG